jgi:2'-5' RNA ligase
MLPGDRLVCVFVDEFKVGDIFSKWPLHVTIVPWFRLKASSDQLRRGLQKALRPIRPFRVEVGEVALFGPKKNRPAHLLEPSQLSDIEQRVRRYLQQKRSWLVDETTMKRRPFKAHITFQGDEHLEKGSIVPIDNLYIVKQHGNHKSVEAVVEFKP